MRESFRTERTTRRPAILLICVLSLTVLAGITPPDPALAGTGAGDDSVLPAPDVDHLVVAGALERDWPTEGTLPRFEYLAYYPTNLQVHRGDVVYFRIDGFHTVTFSPEGQERQGWLRRDEVEPSVSVANHEPTNPECGTSVDAPPCVLNGTDQYVNSGWKLPGTDIDNDLKLEIDLPEGTYNYYCTIHTGMQGQIEVVDDSQPIATPEEVAEERDAEIAADTTNAQTTLAQPWPLEFEQIDGTDRRRYRVQAGAFTPDKRVAINQFLPSNVEIASGDEVEFFVPEGGLMSPDQTEPVFEAHTVSFPNDEVRRTVGGFARYVNPACDADDVSSGLPGIPMWVSLFTGCPDGLERELLLLPYAWQMPVRAPGKAVVSPATYDDSGVIVTPDVPCRSGCDPWTGERLPSTTTSVFPVEGTFSFSCFLHGPVMGGSVQVAGS